ncbi:MAG: homocysteine S-methyltransferase family protein [Candidatus Latescibacterota bacterium]|nr:homocysteine S-methyltransferase family protein [Candidatus Latescibacterota bacterium]
MNFVEAIQEGTLLCDGAIGSLLFERTGRLSEHNHNYESFNIDRPEIVTGIHLEYLQAGAQVLTTNTFSCNLAHLSTHNQSHRLEEINRAGVLRAKDAIQLFGAQHNKGQKVFIAGSIGPTPNVNESPEEARTVYTPQILALVNGGADAILLETFTSLQHVRTVLEIINQIKCPPPAIVHMSLRKKSNGDWSQDPIHLVNETAKLGACVVGVNCCSPSEANSFLETTNQIDSVIKNKIHLSVMPNGGDFKRIGHRYLTGVNPEFMGKFARQAVIKGTRLVGGCCDVHPEHIHEMQNYLRANDTSRIFLTKPHDPKTEAISDSLRSKNGAFSKKIISNEFAVSVELLPSRGTGGIKSRLNFIKSLVDSGLADAIDLTDGSRGISLMAPTDFIQVIRRRLNWNSNDQIELIPHFTMRDLNSLAIQSRLIGMWANDVHNVLLISGDPPKMSPTYPRSSAVFDLDSTSVIHYVKNNLNMGIDFGGHKLGTHKNPRTKFTVGSGFEPEAADIQKELEKLERKIDAGVDYIMTQPTFNQTVTETLQAFRNQSSFLIGVIVLNGLEHAKRMAAVPGVVIPDNVLSKIARYDNIEDQKEAGAEIASKQIRWAREEGWSGTYLMSPASHDKIIQVLSNGIG